MLAQLPLERRAGILQCFADIHLFTAFSSITAVRRSHPRPRLVGHHLRLGRWGVFLRLFSRRRGSGLRLLSDEVSERSDFVDDEVSHAVGAIFSLE
jgi:hypothetical protein